MVRNMLNTQVWIDEVVGNLEEGQMIDVGGNKIYVARINYRQVDRFHNREYADIDFFLDDEEGNI